LNFLRPAIIALLALAALATVSSAWAQGPDVQIVQLECTGDPELVLIRNLGDAAQTLTGWELQSDPPDTEVYDLSVLGSLAPGASVSIQSGPSASGVFKWGLEFVFRDDDPTDYARIVDDTGAVVHQVNCGATSTPTPPPGPPAVGGIVELRTDSDAPSERSASSAPLPIGASVALGLLVLGAGGLYVVKLRRG
jgi:hypothetical protein